MVQFDSNQTQHHPIIFYSDESIIVQNREILHRFWRDQYRHLVGRVRPLCGGSQDRAEDLVSQATLRLVQFVEAHDRPLIEIGALFWRVLRNLAIDQHRSARCAAAVYDHSIDLGSDAHLGYLPPAGDDTHAQVAACEALAAVQRRVDGLPEEARALFVHRFVEDRSYREIAVHFRISEALARKRVQKLRALLAERPAVAEKQAEAPSQKCAPHVYSHEAA